MDFIGLENQFRTLSRDCFSRLEEAENKLREEIEKKFQALAGSSEIEAAVLNRIEAEIEAEVASFQAALDQIKTEIRALETKTGDDSALAALEAKLTEEAETRLHPFLSELKKKKNDLGQKISVLKKELANFHKENNLRLIEEEKQFLAREAELNRRLAIDLERKNEANIKAYSEYEKKLLSTDEEKEISELKEKIKEIRIAGVREMKNIKDQYAFLRFENRLEFRKFSENVVLENSLKAEETKFRVRALESEKEKTEQETESERQKAAFEIKKALLEKERDLEIEKNKSLLESKLAVLGLDKKAAETESASLGKRKILGAAFRKEAARFDINKTEIYAGLNDAFFAKLGGVIESLVNHLQAYVKLFKEILLSLLQEFEEESKAAHDRFKGFLWIVRREEFPEKTPKHLLFEITKLTEASFKKRKQIYEDAAAFIGAEIAEIIYRIRNINAGLSSRRAQLKDHEKNYFRNLKSLLEKGYLDLEEPAPNPEPAPEKADFRREHALLQKEAAKKETEIVNEYHRKLEKLKAENSAYFDFLKKEEQRRLREDRAFQKRSKKRKRELKKNFSALISEYEKRLYAEYMSELEKNLSEEKEKIKEL